MRDRLIYILKHNRLIQKLYIVIMSFIFRVWGVFQKTDESFVLFVSFMGKNFNDSPKVLYDYMQSHPEYKKYHCVWAFEHPENFPELDTVKIDTPAYFKMTLKAKYWITNTNIERGLKFKKNNQIYLNTWHGIALKFIGNDCPGRKDYNFDTLDYLTVSGDYDERVFKSAFNAKESSYLRCGMPRNEELWLADDAAKVRMRNKLDIPEEKKLFCTLPHGANQPMVVNPMPSNLRFTSMNGKRNWVMSTLFCSVPITRPQKCWEWNITTSSVMHLIILMSMI